MRTWVTKQKKKDETKAASQAATPAVDAAPAPSEVQASTEAIEKTADHAEDLSKGEAGAAELGPADDGGDANPRSGSAAAQPQEVSQSLHGCRRRCSGFGVGNPC